MSRSDGRRIKNVDPEYRIMPHLLKNRTGSLLYYHLQLEEDPFNEYIKQNHEKGIELNLQSLLVAGMIRTVALRPAINRFIMNGKIYARNSIQLSMQVKRSMDEDSTDASVKFTFTGRESVSEVKKIMDDSIKEVKGQVDNNTDKLVGLLVKIPNFVLKFVAGLVWWLDRRGWLPKSVIQASPFHTTIYFTNLRSIRLGELYHHLYDFGTAGVFASFCRGVKKPVLGKDGQVTEKRFIDLLLTLDERMCDGFYWSVTLREMERIISDFSALEKPLDDIVHDIA